MASLPQISDAEWEVMKALWAGGPATAGEVVARVSAENRWKPRTIKTLLARLVKKRAVGTESEGRRFLYRALVGRDACIRQETRSFLSRVFNGAAAPAIVHFIEQGRFTQEEIQQLKETLEREGRS